MKHTYTLTGKTCNGFKASVDKKRHVLNHKINVPLNFEKGDPIIKIEKHLLENPFQPYKARIINIMGVLVVHTKNNTTSFETEIK